MTDSGWEGVAPQQSSDWEGTPPTVSTDGWEGAAPVAASPTHDWGTTDARDKGVVNSAMSSDNKREVGASEGASRELKNVAYRVGAKGMMPVFGAGVLVDKARQMLGAESDDFSVSEAIAKYTGLDAAKRVVASNELDTQKEKFSGTGSKVATNVVRAVGDVGGDILLGMGLASAYTRSAPVIKQVVEPLLAKVVAKTTPSLATGVPMASSASAETYQSLKQQGVSEEKAIAAATTKGLFTLMFVAAPASATGNVLKRAATGGGANTAQTWADADMQNWIVGKVVENPDLADYIVASVVGGTFGVAFGDKPTTPETKSSLEADAKKAVEDIIKQRDPGLGADVDTAKAKAPQYLGANSKATIALENQASDYAAKQGIDYEPANRQLELQDARGRHDPDFFDTSELAAAEAKANRSAQATSNLPQAADVMMGIPDVKEEGIVSPNMTPEELIRAQSNVEKTGEPAHSVMEIPEEMGFDAYWPDKMLEKAKGKANNAAEQGFGDPVDRSVAPAFKLDDAFLKAASKKEGGSIDLSAYTGVGFEDLQKALKRASNSIWSAVDPSFKTQFKNAYLVDRDGNPTPFLHGTNYVEIYTDPKTGKQYEVPFDKLRNIGDGGMLHMGGAAEATIINDSNYKASQTIVAYDGERTSFPSLTTEIQLAQGKILPEKLTEKQIADVREKWLQDRNAWAEAGLQKDLKGINANEAYLKENFKRIQSMVKEGKRELMWHKYKKLYDSITENLGDDTINSLLNAKDDPILMKHMLEVRFEDLKRMRAKMWHVGSVHQHMLWTNIENPIWISDVGAWADTQRIIDELLKGNFTASDKVTSTDFAPIPIRRQMPNTKAQEVRSKLEELRAKYKNGGGSQRDLYAYLDTLGYDGFIYENRAENPRLELNDNKYPIFSVATWRMDKVHRWGDAPKKTDQPFVPRSQRGSLNVGEIAKGITEQYDNAKDLLSSFKDRMSDIKFSQKMLPLTANQAGEWFGNPVIEWSYNRLRRIGNDIDVRANLNKIYLKDVIDFMKSDRENALKMVNTLVKIQDPALKEARAAAEASGAREAFLASQGMPESVIPHAIKVLDVMKATGIYDQNVAYDFRGKNFHLEPMYFPKEHTGPFTVYIKQADGTVVHAQPFEHMKGARQYEQAFKKSIPEGADMIVSLERNEAGRMGDIYSMLNITGDKLPDFLREINDKLLKDIEVAKRKFEMERSSHNITGATGETIFGDNDLTSWKRAQDQRALSLIQRRLESSYSLEKAKRIIKEIKEPFLEDPMGMLDKEGKPMLELTNYMHQLIARELGLDISKFQAAQKATVDRAVTGFGKTLDEIAGKMRGYKGGDMSYFKPNEVARLIQTYVWLMSVSKLGWSVPVLAANATTGLLAPVDGIRTAMREGINPGLAVLSGMKTMMATLDPDAMQWLQQADLEGMVEPRISDPMTFVQTHYRTAADKFVNAARDFVEKKTNQVTLAYYYNFYKMAYPDLNPLSDQFKTKVYKAARSWTGDYTNEAQVMQLSQLGYVGQLHSNFAKWKYNQLGRLAVDLKQAFQGNALPMAMTMMIGVMLAGAMGAPVAVEYENFRKALKTLSEDTIDLKPWARAYSDLREWGKENLGTSVSTVMDVLERGPMMYYGDKAAKEFGFNSGIDMSANLKYSALSDVSTLPFSFGGEQYKGISAAIKTLWKVGTENPTNEQMKDMAKIFPVVVSRPLQELIENKIQTGDALKQGYVQQFASQAKGSYRQTPWEKGLAYGGFKTVAENQEMDKIFGKEWNDRRVKTLITKQIKRMETNLDKPEVLKDAATQIFEERGVSGVQSAINALLQRKQDVNTTYFERELMRSVNVPDPIARARLLHELRKFLPAE